MELLLSIPGVSAFGDSAFSVLGAASTQNITTLDGVRVREGGLPPDALASVRVVTSSADPAVGGGAGARVTQSLRGGTDIFAATIRFSGSNRGLVWNDPTWTRPVSRPLNHSGTANGPIVKQRLHYNVSWSVEDNTSDWFSLLDPRGAVLAQRGISLDTVAAVTSTLQGLGIPLSLSSGPQEANSRQFRVSEVLDFRPSATASLRLSHTANVTRSIGTGASETAFPTRVNELGTVRHSVGLRGTGYFRGLLNEFTAGFSYYSDRSDPFTPLPGGTVRIGTDCSDGRTGFASLGFGGGNGEYYEQTWGSEARHEISWIPGSGAHRVKIGGQIEGQRSNYFYFPGSPLLGQYTYLSTADLAANRPASYERVLVTTPRRTTAMSSALWIGDEWRASPAWQWQAGLRLEFTHLSTVPRYNPAVDATFGVRTDRIPRDVG